MSSVVGIEQGTCVLFSDFADGGVMWTGQGDRETRQVVRFNEAFLKQPSVMVSMSMWDVDNKHNSRVDLVAENITETGFELLFRTWGDTRIARIRADWMAIGAVHDPETWQLY